MNLICTAILDPTCATFALFPLLPLLALALLPPTSSPLLSLSTLFSSPLRGGTCKKYSCKRLVQLYRRKYCASFQFFKISTAPCTVRMLPLPVHTFARPHMHAHAVSGDRCPLTRICLADGLCGGTRIYWRPCKSTSSRSRTTRDHRALQIDWRCQPCGASGFGGGCSRCGFIVSSYILLVVVVSRAHHVPGSHVRAPSHIRRRALWNISVALVWSKPASHHRVVSSAHRSLSPKIPNPIQWSVQAL